MTEIERIIAQAERRMEELRPQVEAFNRAQEDLAAAKRVQQRLAELNGSKPRAERPSREGPSVADLSEEILRAHGGKLRAKELQRLLSTEKGREVSQPVLSSAIMRYAKKKKRFRKPAPGVYALID
jgi:hypothetical protein